MCGALKQSDPCGTGGWGVVGPCTCVSAPGGCELGRSHGYRFSLRSDTLHGREGKRSRMFGSYLRYAFFLIITI